MLGCASQLSAGVWSTGPPASLRDRVSPLQGCLGLRQHRLEQAATSSGQGCLGLPNLSGTDGASPAIHIQGLS